MLKKTNKIYRKPEAFPFAVNTVFSRLELCPVTTILQKAQTNDCMHLKYFKELNESYEKVSKSYYAWRIIEPAAFAELCVRFILVILCK